MKKFRYELHAHTAEGSKCSKISAADLVSLYKEKGYDGVCISDHFTGNTTVPKGTPWKERIDYFYLNGYEKAVAAGEKIGMKVFIAPEFSSKGNDFLLLGLTKEWWKEQEDFLDLPINAQFDRVHEGGGFIIHAHPFAEESWVECIRLFPTRVDAVEVLNGNERSGKINVRAYYYALDYGLRMTGGTDLHSADEKNFCGVETETECHTAQALIDAIRSGKTEPYSALQGYLVLKNYNKK